MRARWRVVAIDVQTCHASARRARLPCEQVAPRRRVVGLSDSSVTSDSGSQPLGPRRRAGGRSGPAAARASSPGLRDERHHADRALADADAATDALADLDRVLHHPRQRLAEALAVLDPRPSGRLMSRASTGQTSMQMPQLMQPAVVDVDAIAHESASVVLTSIRASGSGTPTARGATPDRDGSGPIRFGLGPRGPSGPGRASVVADEPLAQGARREFRPALRHGASRGCSAGGTSPCSR